MKRSLLIRRLRDEDGNLVTYLPTQEATRLAGLSRTTIGRWCRAGIVRHTDRLNGSRNVAMVDVVRLCTTPSKVTLAEGIVRVPPSERVAMDEYFVREQTKTKERATNHREPWDDYDDLYLTAAYFSKTPVEDMAIHLGRTYAAISNRLDVLKAAGEIPRDDERDDSWLEVARGLLTDDERRSLETA